MMTWRGFRLDVERNTTVMAVPRPTHAGIISTSPPSQHDDKIQLRHPKHFYGTLIEMGKTSSLSSSIGSIAVPNSWL